VTPLPPVPARVGVIAQSEAYSAAEEARIKEAGQAVDSTLYYMKQTIGERCGPHGHRITIASVHHLPPTVCQQPTHAARSAWCTRWPTPAPTAAGRWSWSRGRSLTGLCGRRCRCLQMRAPPSWRRTTRSVAPHRVTLVRSGSRGRRTAVALFILCSHPHDPPSSLPLHARPQIDEAHEDVAHHGEGIETEKPHRFTPHPSPLPPPQYAVSQASRR